jgi:hypothetical protein
VPRLRGKARDEAVESPKIVLLHSDGHRSCWELVALFRLFLHTTWLLAEDFEGLGHAEDHGPDQSGDAQPRDERETRNAREDDQNGHSPASAQNRDKSPITASVTIVSSQRSLRVYGLPRRLMTASWEPGPHARCLSTLVPQ